MFKAQEIKQEIKRQVRKGLSIFVPWEPPLMVKDLSPLLTRALLFGGYYDRV